MDLTELEVILIEDSIYQSNILLCFQIGLAISVILNIILIHLNLKKEKNEQITI